MADECDHCWHYKNIQHAMQNHRCERCCHCGEDRCRMLTTSKPDDEHGPHKPSHGSINYSIDVSGTGQAPEADVDALGTMLENARDMGPGTETWSVDVD